MAYLRRLVLVLAIGAVLTLPEPLAANAQSVPQSPGRVFLPMVASAGTECLAVSGETYAAITVSPPPTDRPAEQHADLNLALRGYTPTTGFLGLIDYGGPFDPRAPQLAGIFTDNRTGAFVRLHRVHGWNWPCNCQGAPLTTPSVTLAELATVPGELLHVPSSGYSIGALNSSVAEQGDTDYEVLVLYAAEHRITLKYTRNDNVIHGYTLHFENICVDPNLLATYTSWNQTGRSRLPALRAGQAFARASGPTIGVSIRDSGTFLDPRSRKDWWQGR